MTQIWKIFQWEYMNRVKSKLFLITTFLLPFFMGGMMYLPSILMDLEPEETSEIGLVYQDNILDLVQISNYILGMSTPAYECAADFTGDGNVNILDLVQIANFILNN